MAISEIVGVSVIETQAGTTLASFDTPAILAAAADTTPDSYTTDSVVAKLYTLDTDGQASVDDDWGGSSLASEMFAQMVAQEPRPESAYIIKRGTPVATVKKITITGSLLSGQTVTVTVNGESFSSTFATDQATTLAALASSIQSGAFGVATAAHATGVITITATSEYELSVGTAVASGSGTLPTFATTTFTAGRVAADDIADALAEDDTNLWYGLVTADTSVGVQLSVAKAIESSEKFYWLRTDETASKTAGGTDALAIRLAALNYRRTLGFWHHDTTEYIDGAALAKYLGSAPGSIDLAHTELAGVTVSKTSDLSAAAVTVLEGRHFNTYRAFGEFGLVRRGVRVDGTVAEATRDLDYAKNEYTAAFLVYISQTKKPPYDTSGLAAIRSIGEQVTRRLVKEGVFRGDVAATFYVPKMEDISASNQAAQLVPGCKVTATLLKGVIEITIPLEIAV